MLRSWIQKELEGIVEGANLECGVDIPIVSGFSYDSTCNYVCVNTIDDYLSNWWPECQIISLKSRYGSKARMTEYFDPLLQPEEYEDENGEATKKFKDLQEIENVVNKSKTTGEPPLMLAMSVFFAIKDAIASVGDYKVIPVLDAPATPEKILMSIKNLRAKL